MTSPPVLLEVWLDTSDWNEGFEKAREPWTTVVVADAAEADIVTRWMATYSVNPGDGNQRFLPRRHIGSETPVPARLAIAYLSGSFSTWGGI